MFTAMNGLSKQK